MDKKSFPRSLLLSLVFAFAALLLPLNWVFADEAIDLRQQLISRISLLEGDASVRHRGSQDWEEAGINLPLAAGDSIYTGRNSRLELQVYLLFIRLSEDTSLEAVELNPNRYRFNLSIGTATFSAEDEIKEFEISTPRAAVLIKRAGVYRINVLPNGDTEVVTLTGETELISDNGSRIKLKEGKKATFGSDPSDVEISATYISDYWDGWNQERDNLLKISSDTDRHISRNGYLYGISDLDAYGTWVNVPRHGWSWQPRNVGVGWSPYRVGRWSYLRWGWTWISFEPWGWLPYHYGGWSYLDPWGWVWTPNLNSWYWSPSLVYWYRVNNNNRNYVCWSPRPVPTQSENVGPNLPVAQGKGKNSNDKPVSVNPDDLGISGRPRHDGITVLEESEFINSGRPRAEQPSTDIVRLTETVKPTDVVGVNPVGSIGRGLKSDRPLVRPAQDIASRPVVTVSNSGQSEQPIRIPRNTGANDNKPRINQNSAKGNVVTGGATTSGSTVSAPKEQPKADRPKKEEQPIFVPPPSSNDRPGRTRVETPRESPRPAPQPKPAPRIEPSKPIDRPIAQPRPAPSRPREDRPVRIKDQ